MEVHRRPHVQEILTELVPVASVPFQTVLGISYQVLFFPQVEAHAREELRASDICEDCYLE